jgi:NADH:ubiquinone oxidoreductase subunit 5 (subunit L)/multisubunit Na+/H+ antiporter MnhA subunit
MGGLIRVFPLTYVMIFIGSIALMGFPFLTGFYSKDAILEVAVSRYSWKGNFAYILGCSAAFCTAFYSFRLVFLTFVNVPNSFKTYIEHAHEPSLRMLIPLFVLAFGSLFSGFMFKEMFVGLGTPFFEGSIFVNYTPTMLDGEFLSAIIKNIPLIFTIAGVGLSALFIHFGSIASPFTFSLFDIKMSNTVRSLYIFLSQKWHFDQVANELVVHKLMCFGDSISFQLLDKGCIERFGPLGISQTSLSTANQISFMHSGLIFHYLLIFIIGVIGTSLIVFGGIDKNLSIGLVLFTYLGFTKLI